MLKLANLSPVKICIRTQSGLTTMWIVGHTWEKLPSNIFLHAHRHTIMTFFFCQSHLATCFFKFCLSCQCPNIHSFLNMMTVYHTVLHGLFMQLPNATFNFPICIYIIGVNMSTTVLIIDIYWNWLPSLAFPFIVTLFISN